MNERKEYKMVHDVDAPLVQNDSELFSLNSICKLLERRKQIEENLERYRQKRREKESLDAQNLLEKYESSDNMVVDNEVICQIKDCALQENLETKK